MRRVRQHHMRVCDSGCACWHLPTSRLQLPLQRQIRRAGRTCLVLIAFFAPEAEHQGRWRCGVGARVGGSPAATARMRRAVPAGGGGMRHAACRHWRLGSAILTMRARTPLDSFVTETSRHCIMAAATGVCLGTTLSEPHDCTCVQAGRWVGRGAGVPAGGEGLRLQECSALSRYTTRVPPKQLIGGLDSSKSPCYVSRGAAFCMCSSSRPPPLSHSNHARTARSIHARKPGGKAVHPQKG